MGTLLNLTKEYFGETEREEDKIELSKKSVLDGKVIRHKFTDKNGKTHPNGFFIPSGLRDILRIVVDDICDQKGENCDLNMVDVSNIKDFSGFFSWTDFDGDISGWDVSSALDMSEMFFHSEFNGDISKWNVSNVNDFSRMFQDSLFDGDLNEWKVKRKAKINNIFYTSPIETHAPLWWWKRMGVKPKRKP